MGHTRSNRAASIGACFTEGSLTSSLHGVVPLAADGSDSEGYIRFSVNFIAPDLSQLPQVGQRVLETLLVNFR